MKIDDKLLCKIQHKNIEDLMDIFTNKVDLSNFFTYKQHYNIKEIDDLYIHVEDNTNYIWHLSKNDIDKEWYVYNYFYSPEEIRKLKLNTI